MNKIKNIIIFIIKKSESLADSVIFLIISVLAVISEGSKYIAVTI